VQHTDTVEVLTNGDAFYAAELAAIQASRLSVHIEAFILHPSRISDRFLAALIACANRGVRVRVVVDAIGSFPTPNSYFEGLRAAGGRVAWYQPIRWYTLKRFNNRSHRDLIVVDGKGDSWGGGHCGPHWSEPAGQPALARHHGASYADRSSRVSSLPSRKLARGHGRDLVEGTASHEQP
jgi:cardiolipin synthase